MSCCNQNPCTCAPTCNATVESTASALDNFISAFFGSVTKTCVNNKVVWILPCDLNSGIPGYPRIEGEGLACYYARVFALISQSVLIRVDNSDTVAGNLIDKLSAGTGVSFSILNPGGDEMIQISLSMPPGQSLVTGADTTPDYLNSKVTVGAGLSKSVVNPGANETLNLVNSTSGQVKVTTNDTTPDFLNSKVTAGNWVTKSTLNPGANENLKLNFAPSAAVSIAAADINWTDPNYTFFKTLGANTVFTFSNTVEGKTIIAVITNTAGNFTVIWPAGIKWPLGVSPTQSTGAVADVYTFIMAKSIIYGAVSQGHQ